MKTKVLDKRSQLFLVISSIMTERDENSLARMSLKTRRKLDVEGPISIGDKNVLELSVRKAYLDEIRMLRSSNDYSIEELDKVVFVSRKTFESATARNIAKVKSDEQPPLDTILVGADPEFLLFNNDKIVHANSVMQKEGKLGSDGAMAEIRPAPSDSTIGIVRNISEIFENNTITKPIQQYKWLAGCYFKNEYRDFPVGGHIHVSNPKKIQEISPGSRFIVFAILNKILDELIAIPMTRLDGRDPGSCRRTKCGITLNGGNGYGYFGEWRECQGRLEHRTLSGMWLSHPSLTGAVLGTARAVIEEFYSLLHSRKYDQNYLYSSDNKEIFRPRGAAWQNGFDEWEKSKIALDMGCIRSSTEMNNFLNSCDPTIINTRFISKWMNMLKEFSTYKKYCEYVDTLSEVLRIPTNQFQEFTKDLRKNWVEKLPFII